jgi:hypothetical protein
MGTRELAVLLDPTIELVVVLPELLGIVGLYGDEPQDGRTNEN